MQSLVKVNRSFFAAVAALAAVIFAPMQAAHADIDVSQLVSQISGQVSNIETIGMAILGVLVVITGISLLRRIIH